MTVSDLHKFFLVVPPGFEDLAFSELRMRGFAHKPMSRVRGGLEFECSLAEGLALNSLSRIGTRVLMRLTEFRCRDFPKLFKKILGMPWHQYIKSGANTFTVEVTARKSRLINQKRIAETVSDGVEKSLKKNAGKKAVEGALPTEIFVRFDDDTAQISLDTSGEALFKRGYKTLEALAPLRENFAAGLFYALYERAGRPATWELVDPLCGSGTFLSEAGLFFGGAAERGFDFKKWFNGEVVSPAATEPVTSVNSETINLFGLDRHPDALKLSEENLRAASVKNFKIQQKDFLKESLTDILPKKFSRAVRFGIANPPYGVRIQLPAPPTEFYAKLAGAFETLHCDIFGFIVPREHLRHVPKPASKIDFSNGGIDVCFVIF